MTHGIAGKTDFATGPKIAPRGFARPVFTRPVHTGSVFAGATLAATIIGAGDGRHDPAAAVPPRGIDPPCYPDSAYRRIGPTL